jgi:hypothetical protein
MLSDRDVNIGAESAMALSIVGMMTLVALITPVVLITPAVLEALAVLTIPTVLTTPAVLITLAALTTPAVPVLVAHRTSGVVLAIHPAGVGAIGR